MTGRARRLALTAIAVLASWLLAIAGLSAAVAALPVTPGNQPDHLD
ncbi:MAG: hypothetical protein JF588_11670 [Caulobacterales bacterium]|nr:hypothetical protein [Caulobacterales bacterium]